MILSDGTIISRAEVSPHKFGGDPMAEYLHYLAGISGQDRDTGSVEFHGWVGQFGKRLLCEDSQGFVSVTRYASVAEATAEFDDFASEYDAWDDEGGDE